MLIPIEHELFNNDQYLKSLSQISGNFFPERIIKTGMIEWDHETACNWGGPFEKFYAFVKITDWSSTCLDSLQTLKIRQHTSIRHSVYNIPYSARKRLGYDNLIVIGKDGKEYGRSQLTYQELKRFNLESTHQEKYEWVTNKSKNNYEILQQSIEYPIVFYICGNDDFSYTRLYETAEDALNALILLKETPTWEHLKFLGFKFSN